MSDKFKGKYRTKSLRKSNWDYGLDGYYFVTICTKKRECCFGKIVNDKIALSDEGILADKFWNEIPNQFEYVKLDELQIMPNHIHGILQIENKGCTRRDAINRIGVRLK